ncbi:WYL domain protein [compost metagenome]
MKPKIDAACLATVQTALIENRQLTCSYYSAHRDQLNPLLINPLGLVQRGDITYLIAMAEPYEDARQFALHRMSDVAIMDSQAKAPNGFDLKAYAASGAMQFGDNATEVITLEAWVNDGLLRLLRETPLSETMETMSCEDGGWIRANVADSWELEWWLLSHTGSIAVTAPVALKQRLLQRLRKGIELYDNE